MSEELESKIEKLSERVRELYNYRAKQIRELYFQQELQTSTNKRELSKHDVVALVTTFDGLSHILGATWDVDEHAESTIYELYQTGANPFLLVSLCMDAYLAGKRSSKIR
ncbi:hypothetical protein COV11_01815 [Candidatus Woesearchaeota archaeon CG10_big_fil_rev_8_21_14_0_10_30_7]|nr:MAG: hypothetical protein COV11_01815 [Candidatus Woesearchaeota archaeon CG10_big_fil_rev_8_21_14_0_10_30_7]